MKLSRPRASAGRPTITAVIPCYNYGRYLPDATRAVLTQEAVEARVIIVDDASPDGSGDVARELAAGDARISVIQHAENAGHIRSYNDGLAAVETEYVTLISADDLVAPGAFARATALMEAFPEVGLVYGRAPWFSTEHPAERDRSRHPQFWAVWTGRAWLRRRARAGENAILSPEAVMRTAAVAQLGGYNPELPHSGDLEYWLRCCAAGWGVGRVVGRDQAYYRVHAANMHTQDFADEVVELEHRLGAFEFLRDRVGADEGESAFLRSAWGTAREAVACRALRSALRRLDRGGAAAGPARLLEFAERVAPEAWPRLRARVGRLVARARAGHRPTRGQAAEEWMRHQGERVRFKVLGSLGE